MRRAVCVLALAAILAVSPLSAVTLTILHTSDLHGRVDPHDALEDRDLGEGLARVAAAVAAIRAEGRPTLLLDSGDTIQGSPTQALVFAGKGGGDGSDPIVRAMNRLGYDAMAVGNHEFDFGMERLERSRREARFPWLSANALRADGAPAFEPYVVRELAGVRVGILGLVTQGVADWESPAMLAGTRFADSVELARRYVPQLRGKERCDLVVVVTHQGFERDVATGEGSESGENQAYALATRVPGIDVLLAGHAHVVVAPRLLGSTWVSEPGRWGNALTRFDVTLEQAGGGWRVAGVRGRTLHMRSVRPDPAIVAEVKAEQDATLAALAESLATLEEPVSARDVRARDSGLLDWLHAVQLAAGKAELSFCSLLPNALADWPAGPLALRQVWAFYPYENSLVTVRATGRQVRAALERAAECLADPGARGRNCDTLQGADYVLDASAPRGHRVIALTRNGRELRDDETFTVALNSYRASGGGGYPMWKGAPRLAESGNVRDLLVADARRRGRLRLEADGNWRVVGGR